MLVSLGSRCNKMDHLESSSHSLNILSSLNSEQIESLRQLGITNLGDLLAYAPFRRARYIRAAKDCLLRN